jgi:hypothetical protein
VLRKRQTRGNDKGKRVELLWKVLKSSEVVDPEENMEKQ